MKEAKGVGNNIAHGHICNYSHGGKFHPRISSPPFSPKITNMLAKASLPGMGSVDLTTKVGNLNKLVGCIDRFNEVITAYREFGGKSLIETIGHLELNLHIAAINSTK